MRQQLTSTRCLKADAQVPQGVAYVPGAMIKGGGMADLQPLAAAANAAQLSLGRGRQGRHAGDAVQSRSGADAAGVQDAAPEMRSIWL
jgi:hypothetical protein